MELFQYVILFLLGLIFYLKPVLLFKSKMFDVLTGLRLNSTFLSVTPQLNTRSRCALECMSHASCKSASYCSDLELCELSRDYLYDDGVTTEIEGTWEILNPTGIGKELIFRATAYCEINVYETWTGDNIDTLPQYTPGCLTMMSNSCNTHFRSHMIDHWDNLDILKVFVELYTDGEKVAYITFNGTGSDNYNWFSFDRILDSSLGGIFSGPYNVFSLHGDRNCGRHFFINKKYGGCENDAGWLIINDQKYCCNWDNQNPYPSFKYANGSLPWQTGAHGFADVFAVFVERDTT